MRHHFLSIIMFSGAFSFVFCGCVSDDNQPDHISPILIPEQPECVAEMIGEHAELTEPERELVLSHATGKNLEYWIKDESDTPGCHWHLEHLSCEKDGCHYKCKETEKKWILSGKKKVDGIAVGMVKLDPNSTLPQSYTFKGHN